MLFNALLLSSISSHCIIAVQVGKAPNVKSVCLCFPFPFFALEGAPSSTSCTCAPEVPVDPHAELVGTDSPLILRSDWFPLTEPFGARVTEDGGNSGNAAFDNAGVLLTLLEPLVGLGAEKGVREPEAVAALADQGVECCGCRKAGAFAGEADDFKAGNRSGSLRATPKDEEAA